MNRKTDVIIIGAGLAGLRAAALIGEFGHKVLVLEAKEEVGGRIKTFYNQDQIPIEMGPDELTIPEHDSPSALLSYLKQAKISLIPIHSENAQTFTALGEPKKLENLFLVAKDYYQAAQFKIKKAKKEIIEEKKEKQPNLHYPSLFEALAFSKEKIKLGSPAFIGQQTLTAMIKSNLGCSPQKISLSEWMTSKPFREKSYFIEGGLQSLPNLIARKALETQNVFFKLNTPVSKINRNLKEEKITVLDCRGEQYEARYVICTLPPGVLKDESIRFSPPLSTHKKTLLKHLEIGFQNKVILEFESPFWPTDVHYIFPGSQDVSLWPEYLNFNAFSTKETAILICHYSGEEAKFGFKKDLDIVEMSLAPLRKVFGAKMSPLKSFMITRWDTDPYAQGTTSRFSTQFQEKDLNYLAKPESGGLFFAGAYTLGNTKRETLEGASLSGLHAAISVLAKLGGHRHRTRHSLSLHSKSRFNRG